MILKFQTKLFKPHEWCAKNKKKRIKHLLTLSSVFIVCFQIFRLLPEIPADSDSLKNQLQSHQKT
jgi:hypothetical protein